MIKKRRIKLPNYILLFLRCSRKTGSWRKEGCELFRYHWFCNRKVLQFRLKAKLLRDINCFGIVSQIRVALYFNVNFPSWVSSYMAGFCTRDIQGIWVRALSSMHILVYFVGYISMVFHLSKPSMTKTAMQKPEITLQFNFFFNVRTMTYSKENLS